MAIATYRSEGNRIDYTPGSDVPAGEVVYLNGFFGIATQPIVTGDLGSLAIEGIFAVERSTGSSTARGVDIYFDDSASKATTVSTDNDYLGKCVADAATADTTVDVKINVNE